jgi:hypothetical protein
MKIRLLVSVCFPAGPATISVCKKIEKNDYKSRLPGHAVAAALWRNSSDGIKKRLK